MPAWTVEDNYPNATVDERNIRQFVALITRGWQHEVSARPSTSEILSDLECLYHQYCHENLMETGAVPRNLFEAISESTIRRPSFGTAFGLFSGSSGNTLDDAMIASFQGQRLFARVTEALQSEEAVQDLDRHDGAWLLVTAEAPHIAVWTSRQWRSLTGYSNEAVLGKCLRELMQGNLTERSVQDEFISNFTKDLGKDEFRQNHALLTLYKQQVMSFTKSNSSSKLDKLIGSADSVDSTGVKSVNSGVSMVSGGSLQSSIHSSMQSGNTVTNVISYKAMIFSLYAYRIKHRAVDVVVENKVPLSTLTSIQQNSDKNNKTTVKRSDEVTRGTIDSNTMRRTSGRYTQSEQTSSLIDSEYRSGDNESVQETSTIASEDQQNRKRAGSGSSLNFMFGSGKKKNSITDSSQLDGASIASSSSYSVKSGPNGQKKIEEKEPPDALIAILFSKFKFVDDASDPDMDSSVMINMLSKDSGVSTTSNTITPESRETRKPFVPPEIKIDSKITRNRTSITIKKIEGAESPVDDHILV